VMVFDCAGYGTITLRSYHAVSGIRSFDISGEQIIDELDSLPRDKAEEVFHQCMGRQRGGPNPTLSVASTPDAGTSGFLCHFFERNEEDNDVGLFRARTEDNIWDSGVPMFVGKLRSQLPSNLAEMYLEGRFITRGEGRVFNQYRGTEPPEADFGASPPRIGLDFNVEACCAVVGYEVDGALHVRDEFVTAHIQDFMDYARKHYGAGRVYVYPDATGDSRTANASPSPINQLRNNGFAVRAPRANPRVQDRVDSSNAAFHQQRVFVHKDRCPRLHNALLEHQYKGDKPQKYDKHPSLDDWTDCFSYLVYGMYPVKPNYAPLSKVGVAWR